MSLISMPFVDTNVDTVLYVVATVVLVATIGAALFGFWEVP